MTLAEQVADLKFRAHRAQAICDVAAEAVSNADTRVTELWKDLDDHNEALRLLALAAEDATKVKSNIEGLINVVVQAIHGDHNLFEYRELFDAEGMMTGIERVIFENGLPRRESKWGDGIKNTVNISERLALLYITGVSPIILLDEPFTNMDVDKWYAIYEAIDAIQSGIPTQIWVVTHLDVIWPYMVKIRKKVNTAIVKCKVQHG